MFSTIRKSLRSLAASVLLAALSLLPATAEAAYTFVNSYTGAGTLSITIPAGGQVIVIAADGGVSGSTLTLTDNLGNTYVRRVSQNDTFLGQTFAIFDCTSPGTTGTATLTLSGATTPGLAAFTYTGLGAFQTGTVVSTTANSSWSTATNGANSPSTTPLSQPAMLFSAAVGSSAITAGFAFTSRLNLSNWNSGNTIVGEDEALSSTAATTSAFTVTSATIDMTILAAVYSIGLAGTASDTTAASGTLTGGTAVPFAPLLLDNAGRSDQISMGSGPGTGTGDNANTAFTKLKQWAADVNMMVTQIYPARSLQTPVTGFSIAAAANITQLVLNPAGTLATGTVTLPQSPGDNQPFLLMTSQTITALIVNTADGATLNGAPTTLTANSSVKFRFQASLNTWFRE